MNKSIVDGHFNIKSEFFHDAKIIYGGVESVVINFEA